MTMGKKEFEAIAKSLRRTREGSTFEPNKGGTFYAAAQRVIMEKAAKNAIRQAALDLLPVLKKLNPRFQEGKFMEVVDGKRK